MHYTHYYAVASGASHIEEIDVELVPRNFAPPAPPLHLSPMMPAPGWAFVRFPVGWAGDWHPMPQRQPFVFPAGELEGKREMASGAATVREP